MLLFLARDAQRMSLWRTSGPEDPSEIVYSTLHT